MHVSELLREALNFIHGHFPASAQLLTESDLGFAHVRKPRARAAGAHRAEQPVAIRPRTAGARRAAARPGAERALRPPEHPPRASGSD